MLAAMAVDQSKIQHNNLKDLNGLPTGPARIPWPRLVRKISLLSSDPRAAVRTLVHACGCRSLARQDEWSHMKSFAILYLSLKRLVVILNPIHQGLFSN